MKKQRTLIAALCILAGGIFANGMTASAYDMNDIDPTNVDIYPINTVYIDDTDKADGVKNTYECMRGFLTGTKQDPSILEYESLKYERTVEIEAITKGDAEYIEKYQKNVLNNTISIPDKYIVKNNIEHLKAMSSALGGVMFNVGTGFEYLELKGANLKGVAIDDEYFYFWSGGYRAWYGSDIITYCKTWPIAMSHPAGFYKVPRSQVLVDWNFAENNYNNEEVVATGTITVPAAKLRIRPTTSFKNKLWEGNTVTVDYSYLLNPGDKVNIVSLEKAGAKKDYYKIVFSTKSSVVPVQYMRDKNILYVSSYYVDVVDPKVTRPTGMTAGKIQKLGTGKVFKIYSEKSTASTVIGNVGNNGIVNVINMEPVQENGAYWVEVWFSNQRGYIKFNKAENVPTYIKSHTHSFAKDWTVIQKATTKADGMIGHKCTVKNADGSACEEYGDKTVVPKIASVKLTPSSVTFNGKKQKPKLVIKDAEGNDITKYFSKTVRYGKNVGIYITTIASKSLPSDPQNIYNRYSMKESLEFKVNPVGTDISSLGKGTKAFTVKWKKQTTDIGRKMEGYQIRYSTSSKMNKSKTKTVKVTYNSHPASLTIKNLAAKKKYYVQIRTYCTVSKTKLYSGWSEVKTVTTK